VSDKGDVIARLRSAVDDFGRLTAALPESRLIEPSMDGWSLRDMAWHFARYHEGMALALERIARGEHPGQADGLSDDQRNQQYAQEARTKEVGEVLQAWCDQAGNCLRAAEALPDERFAEGRSVGRWLLQEAEHYQGHAAQVRSWLGLP